MLSVPGGPHALLSDGLEAMAANGPLPVVQAGQRAGPIHHRGLNLGIDLLWLLGVAVAFTSIVIAFTPLHQGFSWDETVYVSQISQHTPSMPWAAERARVGARAGRCGLRGLVGRPSGGAAGFPELLDCRRRGISCRTLSPRRGETSRTALRLYPADRCDRLHRYHAPS